MVRKNPLLALAIASCSWRRATRSRRLDQRGGQRQSVRASASTVAIPPPTSLITAGQAGGLRGHRVPAARVLRVGRRDRSECRRRLRRRGGQGRRRGDRPGDHHPQHRLRRADPGPDGGPLRHRVVGPLHLRRPPRGGGRDAVHEDRPRGDGRRPGNPQGIDPARTTCAARRSRSRPAAWSRRSRPRRARPAPMPASRRSTSRATPRWPMSSSRSCSAASTPSGRPRRRSPTG